MVFPIGFGLWLLEAVGKYWCWTRHLNLHFHFFLNLCADVSQEQDEWRSRLIAKNNRCDNPAQKRRPTGSRHFKNNCFSMCTFIYVSELSKIRVPITQIYFLSIRKYVLYISTKYSASNHCNIQCRYAFYLLLMIFRVFMSWVLLLQWSKRCG